ncbi:DUF4442 domain-containing protein [Arsenicicoccus dermatophilus]|uniref:DUF4442 domain-containing protein n=1 Tax=Arsenicicoccus dermatophilus TaxID=1076331 RepID=UPI001F4D0B43|nr:DUF4442 domain-containing protein [Arsenicicoccus dermatophilus]MCH8613331.1 DUF4442 domain-containing protein [Arsenicicoccus dermatophilus]
MRLPRNYADVATLVQGAETMRRVMNLWPPFLCSGIHVTEIGEDFRHVQVRLRKHRVTANYVGTQYGGSLYSMTDPFWMIMVLRNLGSDYVVWDKAAEIEFVSPGRTEVRAEFTLTDEHLAEIRRQTEGGRKALVWFDNDVVAPDGAVVARVRKQVYVRRKPGRRGVPGR